jgi:glycosyltransferase involved in cell wall biosynthesis
VDFVGYAGGARKAALWSLADVYVFPSRHESYGLTLAEALRAGRPVITTQHYSAGRLVPPEAGIVVPNAPEAAVAPALWRALRAVAIDPARRARMAAAAERVGRSLDFASAAARVADIVIRSACADA